MDDCNEYEVLFWLRLNLTDNKSCIFCGEPYFQWHWNTFSICTCHIEIKMNARREVLLQITLFYQIVQTFWYSSLLNMQKRWILWKISFWDWILFRIKNSNLSVNRRFLCSEHYTISFAIYQKLPLKSQKIEVLYIKGN